MMIYIESQFIDNKPVSHIVVKWINEAGEEKECWTPAICLDNPNTIQDMPHTLECLARMIRRRLQ